MTEDYHIVLIWSHNFRHVLPLPKTEKMCKWEQFSWEFFCNCIHLHKAACYICHLLTDITGHHLMYISCTVFSVCLFIIYITRHISASMDSPKHWNENWACQLNKRVFYDQMLLAWLSWVDSSSLSEEYLKPNPDFNSSSGSYISSCVSIQTSWPWILKNCHVLQL